MRRPQWEFHMDYGGNPGSQAIWIKVSNNFGTKQKITRNLAEWRSAAFTLRLSARSVGGWKILLIKNVSHQSETEETETAIEFY